MRRQGCNEGSGTGKAWRPSREGTRGGEERTARRRRDGRRCKAREVVVALDGGGRVVKPHPGPRQRERSRGGGWSKGQGILCKLRSRRRGRAFLTFGTLRRWRRDRIGFRWHAAANGIRPKVVQPPKTRGRSGSAVSGIILCVVLPWLDKIREIAVGEQREAPGEMSSSTEETGVEAAGEDLRVLREPAELTGREAAEADLSVCIMDSNNDHGISPMDLKDRLERIKVSSEHSNEDTNPKRKPANCQYVATACP
ncbi:hypothetical protein CONPUDRAFT_73067 [Coniophora puteana RWD-64-598 SS2]|uniref:EF-hand domain-containing protein n=1 Tax=Coniophora puteana (strain RWD-64-598) TaxID=741705 RepID=A0A5M3MQG6_CONPW|nr:uncharacterized protein CONPUDRAFT_73067 [Coniophora puteana RWD-64-598 SS2]EIW81306.1 hypothetical protein CONPUDRAFT_73067 [Coniophora puteana RWD-64-598 SS2]